MASVPLKAILIVVATVIILFGCLVSLFLRSLAEGDARRQAEFTTRACPECGRENSIHTRICPRCNTMLDPGKRRVKDA